MVKKNELLRQLSEGRFVFGTWSNIPSPTVTNILCKAGLDFIVLDLEHGPATFETVENQMYAAEADGVSPVVRIGEVDEKAILHALEIGAQSILVSQVGSRSEADRVVKAMRYHPEGERGVSLFTRNFGYSERDYEQKIPQLNKEMFTGVLVEGKEGLENIESICDIEHLDMIYLGIYDISQVLGVPGEVTNPEVIKVVQECGRLIQSLGKIAGSVAPTVEYMRILIDAGYQFVSYRADSAMLVNSYQEAREKFLECLAD
jgi:4-hydroxy-2-oxoheptanedioate aldolase